MARNCEKKLVGLNRMLLEQQRKEEIEKKPKRPPLHSLHSAVEVKKWIPSIKREIDYYLQQLSGARQHTYPDQKLKEFELKVEHLEKEYKRFVRKVYELDPSTTGIPWQARGYVSKRKIPGNRTEDGPSKKKVISTPLLDVEVQVTTSDSIPEMEIKDSVIETGTADGEWNKKVVSKPVDNHGECKLNLRYVKNTTEKCYSKRTSILGLDYDSSSDDSDGG